MTDKSVKPDEKLRSADVIANEMLRQFREEGIPLPKNGRDVISRHGSVKASVASDVVYSIRHKLLAEENTRKAVEAAIEKAKDEAVCQPEDLPKSWRDKFDIALRKQVREMQAQFNDAVSAKAKELVETYMLPAWRKKINYAEEMQRNWRTDTYALTRDEYKKILVCLHPDRVQDEALKLRYSQAFDIFKQKEKSLVFPEPPTEASPPVPDKFDDIIRMKRKA